MIYLMSEQVHQIDLDEELEHTTLLLSLDVHSV